MDVFAKHCQSFGSLGPFKWFDLYIRGREELVVTIKRAQQGPPPTVSPPTKNAAKLVSTLVQDRDEASPTTYLTASPDSMARTPEPSPPHRDWAARKGFAPAPHLQTVEGGLPPASPFLNELVQPKENETRFLIGAYARYKRPFVWMRSSLGELVAADEPLKLQSTDTWNDQTRSWDIVEELVNLTVFPLPQNAFAIDFKDLATYPITRRVIAQGALIGLLRKLLVTQKNSQHAKPMFLELLKLLDLHYLDLQQLQASKGYTSPHTSPYGSPYGSPHSKAKATAGGAHVQHAVRPPAAPPGLPPGPPPGATPRGGDTPNRWGTTKPKVIHQMRPVQSAASEGPS